MGRTNSVGALLQVLERVAGGLAAGLADQRAAVAARQVAAPGAVADEARAHDAQAARLGEEVVAVADQAARRDRELQAHEAGAGWRACR